MWRVFFSLAMSEILDLTQVFPSVVTLDGFPSELEKFNFSVYQGKDVQLKGCLPSWAFLMVAGKLFGTVKSLTFLVDDGKSGIPVEVYTNS